MKLIDVDLLMEDLIPILNHRDMYSMTKISRQMIGIIDNQPEIIDLESVSKQFEKYSEQAQSESCYFFGENDYNNAMKLHGMSKAYKKVAEIIKEEMLS